MPRRKSLRLAATQFASPSQQQPPDLTTTTTTFRQPSTPSGNPPPSPPLAIDGPKIVNIVAGVNLNCLIDTHTIALHARNAEFNPKRFPAVILRIGDPKATALIFKSGKMVILGARAVSDARLAARKFARTIQKIGLRVRMTDFTVSNMVAHVNVRFPIRLEGVHVKHGKFSFFEPELFPALIYKMLIPKVTLLIFATGKIIILGARKESDFDEAMKKMWVAVKEFQVRPAG